jgi:hypothetical protein
MIDNYEDKSNENIEEFRKEQWKEWRNLYELGANIFPARPTEKHPRVGWLIWQDDRLPVYLFNRYQAEDFKNYDYNAAIVTGDTPKFKIVVVDADDPEAIGLVEELCPPTPLTVQRCPEKKHFWYRHDGQEDVTTVNKIVVSGEKWNLDIKGDKGIIVAPYSKSHKGGVLMPSQPITRELLDSLPVYDKLWLPYTASNGGGEGNGRNDYASSVPDGDYETMCKDQSLPPLGMRLDKARDYLRKVPGTTQRQDNEKQCMILCRNITVGFALPEREAVDVIMQEWAAKPDQLYQDGSHYPWEWKQIVHKVKDAIKTRDQHSYCKFGQKLEQRRKDWSYALADDVNVKPFPDVDEIGSSTYNEPEDADIRGQDDQDERPKRQYLMTVKETREKAALKPQIPFMPGYAEFGALTLLSGLPGCGKSELIIMMAYCSLIMEPFLGINIPKTHFILFDPENMLTVTLQRIDALFGQEVADKLGNWITIVDKDAPGYPDPMNAEFVEARIEELKQKEGDDALIVVVIDTFRTAYNADPDYDENSPDFPGRVMKALKTVADKHKACIWLLHHNNWGGRVSGSTAFRGNADYAVEYKREDGSNLACLEWFRGRGCEQQPVLVCIRNVETKMITLLEKKQGSEKEHTAERCNMYLRNIVVGAMTSGEFLSKTEIHRETQMSLNKNYNTSPTKKAIVIGRDKCNGIVDWLYDGGYVAIEKSKSTNFNNWKYKRLNDTIDLMKEFYP